MRVLPRLPEHLPGSRPAAAVLALLLVLLLLGPVSARTVTTESTSQPSDTGTYTNPVIGTNATTADVTAIRALDGYYYLVASSGTWPGGDYHRLPIFRSKDLVHWTYLRDAFESKPDWIGPGAMDAPYLAYFNHKYYMYYTVFANVAPTSIGVATADSPAGPWTDLGRPLIPPRMCPNGKYCFVIGPSFFIDKDGQKYLYYGSFRGGILVTKLTPDGLHTEGTTYQIGHADRYEATDVIRRYVNGKPRYYMFNSDAPCCQGPNTAYSVVVNRATSPMGPFTDQNGYPMLLNSPVPLFSPDNLAEKNIGAQGGGHLSILLNGNKWHGVGSNTIITDLSGKDWMICYGVDKNEGWVPGLGPNARSTFRQTLLDPVDWTENGWPVVNGGKGPSEGPMPAPVTSPTVGNNFNAPDGCAAPGDGGPLSNGWEAHGGDWRINPGDCVTGGFVRQADASGRSLIVSRQSVPHGSRLECDLRLESGSSGRYGCVTSYQDVDGTGRGRYVAALVDPASNSLVTQAYNNGHPIGQEESTSLPTGFDPTDWQHLVIEQQSNTTGNAKFTFALLSRDGNPLARQTRELPAVYRLGDGSVGFITEGAHADFDNLSAVQATPNTLVPEPQAPAPGQMLSAYSDEFNGKLGPQWSWIREDPSKHSFVDGQLQIIVNGGLARGGNSVTNILVEDQPSGDYMVETKLTFDPNYSYQQAGLLIYSDDDHYIKLAPSHFRSLSKVLTGRETLEPQPDSQVPGKPECPSSPSPSSYIAVKTYSHEQCPNLGEEWGYLINPKPTLNGSTAYDPQVTVWLRIYRHGDVYTPYSSLDGKHWVRADSWSLRPAGEGYPIKVALFANSGGPHNDVPARFDYVRFFRP